MFERATSEAAVRTPSKAPSRLHETVIRGGRFSATAWRRTFRGRRARCRTSHLYRRAHRLAPASGSMRSDIRHASNRGSSRGQRIRAIRICSAAANAATTRNCRCSYPRRSHGCESLTDRTSTTRWPGVFEWSGAERRCTPLLPSAVARRTQAHRTTSCDAYAFHGVDLGTGSLSFQRRTACAAPTTCWARSR